MRELNKDLVNIIKVCMHEGDLIEKAKGYRVELAELQLNYFQNKNSDPRIEEIKDLVNRKFDNLKEKTSKKFDNLMDLEHCERMIRDSYNRSENKSTKNWISMLQKKIKNI